MVINSSNRSPSPMSIRSNSNHNINARNNQERDVLDVRTISGQPRSLATNTPLNSPTEFVRRCSFSKGGISMQDHEKENERDSNLKPVARVQSPQVTKTKNFMSPTISAVSKINPSPRKKVLGERNEAIRTSASLSEGKFQFYSIGALENVRKEDMVTPPSSKEPEKNVTDFSPQVEKLDFEPDLVVLSLEVPMTNEKSPLPPYDPKVNFLSPRPRFLHYKLKPRIKTYINNQGLGLEDGISSDAETEISEVQSEDISSPASVAPSPVEEKSLSLELSSSISQQLAENVEPKIETMPTRFGGIWKAVCLIFFIVLGFVAAYQENFALDNFNGLLSKITFKAKEVKFSPLPYANVTAWRKEEVQDYVLRPAFDRKEEFVLRPSILGQEIEFDSSDDYEAEIDEFVEEFERVKLEENCVEDSVIEDVDFAVEIVEEASDLTELEKQEGEHDITSDQVHDEFKRDFKLDDQSTSSLPQAPDVQLQITPVNDQSIEVLDDFQVVFKVEDQSLPSLPEVLEVQPQDMTTNELVIEASEGFVVPEVTDEVMPQIDEANEGSLAPSIAAAGLFIVSLLAATMFMIMKKPKKENSVRKEKSTYFSAPSKIEPKVHENQTSWISPVEVDMTGQSCPSQISSFQKTSSYNLKGSNEAQSMDKSSKKNYKRESFAASSSEYTMSSSYGSFTTYSILHSKQRDDEVVTPVRRSSRIRGKVASP